MQVITCHDIEQFMDCVYGCVTRGLTFQANATLLQVTLLGGF